MQCSAAVGKVQSLLYVHSPGPVRSVQRSDLETIQTALVKIPRKMNESGLHHSFAVKNNYN